MRIRTILVIVVNTTEYSAMTTSQFASYDALILGDPYCDPNEDITFLNATKQIWSPAITGNVIIIGSDVSYHSSNGVAGAATFIADALPFVVNSSTTGLYFSLSCIYESQTPPVEVDALTEFGNFTVYGVASLNYNDMHVVASTVNLNGLTDSDLSNWYYSVHEVFTSYPSDFVVLAIANNLAGQGQQTFGDGSQGIPYILARGVTPVACGNGQYEPQYGEECDDGTSNGTPGDLCTSACRCVYGVLDATAGTCNHSPGISTITSTYTTSISSTLTQSSTYAVTTAQVVATTTLNSSLVTNSTFTSGSSTGITIMTSIVELTSVFTTSSVVSEISGLTTLTEFTEVLAGTATITASILSSKVSLTMSPLHSSRISGAVSNPAPSITSVSTSRHPGQPLSGNSSGSATRATNPVASPRPHPLTIESFGFMGCYGSDDNYPGFLLTKSDPLMTLEMCIDTCSSHAYAGAYNMLVYQPSECPRASELD